MTVTPFMGMRDNGEFRQSDQPGAVDWEKVCAHFYFIFRKVLKTGKSAELALTRLAGRNWQWHVDATHPPVLTAIAQPDYQRRFAKQVYQALDAMQPKPEDGEPSPPGVHVGPFRWHTGAGGNARHVTRSWQWRAHRRGKNNWPHDHARA